ncbi:hypothetical protein [Streptomyces smyrnaeus]|uniref:hypothetical protein n=1 Tax=Streptomyces smyrnaeus TaxID=1387713 RepID=UPI003682C523
MTTPDGDTSQARPTYRVEVTFHRIQDGRREDTTSITAGGSQTFVTRMTEAAADAFEEEATR